MARLGFTPLQQAFIEEYPIDRNGTKAVVRAGGSANGASVTATRWLRNPSIKAEIEKRLAKAAEDAEMTQMEVLRALKQRATADVRQLCEMRNDCCRFCYGANHQYQETPEEYRRRKKTHDDILRKTPQAQWALVEPFEEGGGKGYDPRKPPVEDCPECWGRGVETILFKDARTYGAGAVAIFEGVKRTKEGLEIKTADRTRAVTLLAQYHKLIGTRPSDEDDPAKEDGVVYNSPSHDPRTDDERDEGGGEL